MRPELTILSFLCTVLLVGLAFLHAKSRNVAILALISWLLVCNVLQGVNSVVWSANAIVRLEVWCDISSKLLLGSRVALPAASTCICVHLHFLSSRRNTKLRPRRTLIEFISCLVIPVIYMALHTIVQDHRFVLAADFGCVSSIFVSVPALILVWIPPFILCISSIIYATLALWRHTHRNSLPFDRAGLSSRLINFTFLRPLLTSVFTTCLILSVGAFDLWAAITSVGGAQQWTGLAHVHADLSQVYIVSPGEHLYLARIEAFWWVVPASTLLFSVMATVGLLLCANHDSPSGFRSAGKWFRSTILRQPGDRETFIQSSREMSKQFTLLPPTTPLPVHLSGWDDSFQSAKSRPKPAPIACDIPLVPTSPSDSESDSDASFKASTLAYLQSPSARDTIEPPLVRSPSQGAISQVAPRWSALLAAPPPAFTSTLSSSPTHSILSSPWPRPPSAVPISVRKSPTSSPPPTLPEAEPAPTQSHIPSPQYPRPPSAASFTGSISSSIMSSGAYLADPDIFLHSLCSPPHRAPFQDAGIPADNAKPLASSGSRSLRRASSKESFNGRNVSLNLKRSGGPPRKKEAYGDTIYMTVVQETQAV